MMGLEETFGKVEKPAKEKKLEVITNGDAVVDELKAYFVKTKKPADTYNDCKPYFDNALKFLESYNIITPKLIAKFANSIMERKNKLLTDSFALEGFGLMLSALMQKSYKEGNNNFKFKDLKANNFGAFLKGKKNKKLNIKSENLRGDWSLWCAGNCSLDIGELEDDWALFLAKNCVIKVKNYLGYVGRFGQDMENCTIKSGNKETLETIKDQARIVGWNNKFELTK